MWAVATVSDSTTVVFSGERKGRNNKSKSLRSCRWTTTIIPLNYCCLGIILPFWKGGTQVFIFLLVRSFGNVAFGSLVLGFRWPLPLFPGSWSLVFVWLVDFLLSSFALWKESYAFVQTLEDMEKLKNVKIYSIAISSPWKIRKS